MIFAPTLDAVRQDLRYAVRGLRRSPGFTLAVASTLALGLGATTAVFSLLDVLFLRPPNAVERPREVKRLYYYRPQDEVRVFAPASSVYDRASFAEYTAMRNAVAADVELGVTFHRPPIDVQHGSPIGIWYATRSYFSVLGVKPRIGRFFAPDEDDIASQARVAVISERFWRTALNADPAILGRQIKVARDAYRIIGVAEAGFGGIDLDRADVWLPIGTFSLPQMPGEPWYKWSYSPLNVVGRARTPATERWLRTVATAAYRRAHTQELPAGRVDTSSTVLTGPVLASLGPSDEAKELIVSSRLAWVAAMLLLIACANVATLLLVRATRRRHEIAVRMALGISRTRLSFQLVIEAVLLATLGGGIALLAAGAASTALRHLLFPDVLWSEQGGSHGTAFMAACCVLVGSFAGCAPALHSVQVTASDGLKFGVAAGRTQSWLRSSLLMGQAAFSMVLLVGAGLFIASLRNLRAIDLGFDASNLITITPRFDHLTSDAPLSSTWQPLDDAAKDIRGVPGVEAVAIASVAPLQGMYRAPLFFAGRDSVPTLFGGGPVAALVSPEYARTVGLRIVMGRDFSQEERATREPASIVNQALANMAWPGVNPLGKCVMVMKRTGPCMRVIGVVRDVSGADVVAPKPFMQVYLPLAGTPLDTAFFAFSRRLLLVRARPGAEFAIMRSARDAILRRLPSVDEVTPKTMSDITEPQLRPWSVAATLFTVMGVLAAFVAAVGVYSVMAYAVDQRQHEMGVRIALGARLTDILRLLVRSGARVVGAGVVLGIALSLALGRFAATLLYGVSSHNVLVLAGASTLLLLCSLGATLAPALRAARVDPANSLRAE